mgnify:CR=1 FL=1|tara:strand:+ start:7063 stop:8646 length:1584 start_codon:yes stop_codon:yes gene_type:complete
MSHGQWTKVEDLSPLLKTGRMVFRAASRQILILKQGERFFAVNNRCPHEGYPLSEGQLSADCTLTCNWHNWKFDLKSGETLVGGDRLRSYPLRWQEGDLYVDLSGPAPEEMQKKALDSLQEAFYRYDYARMGRELARFRKAGGEYSAAVAEVIRRTWDRFEYGMSHAFAAAADWLSLIRRYEAEDRPEAALVAALECVSHFAWDSLRYGRFPYPEKVLPFEAEAFLQAVEEENEAEAVARIRGAIGEGMTYAELRPVLARAALAHYNDFGHAAIYVYKSGQLLAEIGEDSLDVVLLPLVRRLVYATREDLIPEFRAYGPALAGWTVGQKTDLAPEEIQDMPVNRILTRVGGSGNSPAHLFSILFQVLVRNLLHFDVRLAARTDNKVADNVDWLDFTHGLTFANAVRHLCRETPDLWPAALLQMACFAGRNMKYLDKTVSLEDWQVSDVTAFLRDFHEFLLNHGLPEPIISCHYLKTLCAVEEERSAFPDAPWQAEALAALKRFRAHPVRRKHSLRTARQALDFTSRE